MFSERRNRRRDHCISRWSLTMKQTARICVLVLAIFLTLAFIHVARSQGRSFGDFDCTDDCSGHSAGYKWADRHDIDNEDDCPDGNSQSFHEGCIAHARNPYRGAEEDDEGSE